MSTLKVGQQLYFVNRYYTNNPSHNSGIYVSIENIGRKWITLSNNLRIDKISWVADGGQYVSPGRCYISKEYFDSIIELSTAWKKLCGDMMSHFTPADITIEDIQATRKLLRLDES